MFRQSWPSLDKLLLFNLACFCCLVRDWLFSQLWAKVCQKFLFWPDAYMWVTLQSFNRPICVFSKLRDQHGKLVTNAHQVYRYQAGKLNVRYFYIWNNRFAKFAVSNFWGYQRSIKSAKNQLMKKHYKMPKIKELCPLFLGQSCRLE